MKKALIPASVAAALLASPALFPSPASAHHSFAIFDQTKVDYLSGTVKQLEWVNPHAWLDLMIAGDNGKTAVWQFEGASLAQLSELGWKSDSVHPGDKVTIGFRPMKDGSRGGQIMSVKLPDGKQVCSNRGCG